MTRFNIDPDELVSCDSCDWSGSAGILRDIADIHGRLDPGGIVPAGECPECGALAYLVDSSELFDPALYHTYLIDRDREDGSFKLDQVEKYRYPNLIEQYLHDGKTMEAQVLVVQIGMSQSQFNEIKAKVNDVQES